MIPVPPQVQAFEAGDLLTANGMPLRVQGFVSKDWNVAQLASWYRLRLGQPLVENRQGNTWIMGRAQGGYYLSIRLEPAGLQGQEGSKGLLAVSDIAGMYQTRERDIRVTQEWLRRWPWGTRIISRLISQDLHQTSLHLVLRNSYGESLNRETLVDLMQQDGLTLEREVSVAGRTLFFNGTGKQAMATLLLDAQGRTAIVLNTITTPEVRPR